MTVFFEPDGLVRSVTTFRVAVLGTWTGFGALRNVSKGGSLDCLNVWFTVPLGVETWAG